MSSSGCLEMRPVASRASRQFNRPPARAARRERRLTHYEAKRAPGRPSGRFRAAHEAARRRFAQRASATRSWSGFVSASCSGAAAWAVDSLAAAAAGATTGAGATMAGAGATLATTGTIVGGTF